MKIAIDPYSISMIWDDTLRKFSGICNMKRAVSIECTAWKLARSRKWQQETHELKQAVSLEGCACACGLHDIASRQA